MRMLHFLSGLLFSSLLVMAPLTSIGAEPVSTQVVTVYQFNADNPVVPADAIVFRAGIPGVFVVHMEQARFRMVRVGKHRESLTTVLSGLENGDGIIHNPAELYDGRSIQVQP